MNPPSDDADGSGVNTSLFTGDITYYPASTESDATLDVGWHVASTWPIFNGRAITSSPAVPGILECATPFILGPDDAVSAFYAAMNETTRTVALGRGRYVFQCDGAMPDVDVGFAIMRNGGGEDIYGVRADDLAFGAAPAQDYAEAGYTAMEGREGDWCWGSVVTWGA